ncbi:MAG: hypothetical protein IT371_23640 [Deltaproteobacteria bacterium]|nr:hypothetical protein [Deltaproteobacteria bacterium]
MSAPASWLERSHALLENALRTLTSAQSTLETRFSEVASVARAALLKHGDAVAAAERRLAQSIDHDRVVRLIKGKQVSKLTLREARYAARLVGLIAASDLRKLFEERPRCATDFVKQCFRGWSDFVGSKDHEGYAQLIEAHPEAHPALGAPGVALERLVREGGPLELARALRDVALPELLPTLEEHRFDLRWEFSALVVASWFEAQRESGSRLDADWQIVLDSPLLSALLLPDAKGARTDGAAARHRTSLIVRSRFAASLLDAAIQKNAVLGSGALDALAERLMRSSFGDPLVPPESEGWRAIRRMATFYEDFLGQLIRDDLSIFFEEAMQEPDRKAFWLDYVPSIRRTICLLTPEVHAHLKRQLAGADQKRRAALLRSRRLLHTSEVHAFCIVFDSIAVVEFSHSGNAAYVYHRDVFEKLFGGKLNGRGIGTAMDLKRRNECINRIVHNGRWQLKAREQLSYLGVARPQSQVGTSRMARGPWDGVA